MPDEQGRTEADDAVIKAAKTGEGLIPINNMDQLKALAEMAKMTKNMFDEEFSNMTIEQARFVRKLRCEEPEYTWRAVAETCAMEWGGDWGSNQLAGMAICEKAATFF